MHINCLAFVLLLSVFGGCNPLEQNPESKQEKGPSDIELVYGDGTQTLSGWHSGDSVSVIGISRGVFGKDAVYVAAADGQKVVFTGQLADSACDSYLCVYPVLSKIRAEGAFTISEGDSLVRFAGVSGTSDLRLGSFKTTAETVPMKRFGGVMKVKLTLSSLGGKEVPLSCSFTDSKNSVFYKSGAVLDPSHISEGWRGELCGSLVADKVEVSSLINKINAYVPYVIPKSSAGTKYSLSLVTDKCYRTGEVQADFSALSDDKAENIIVETSLSAEEKPTGEKITFQTRNANAVCMDGNTLFVGGVGEISIYDVSKPMEPRFISQMTSLGNLRQMVALDGKLYTTNRETGAFIYDVSDLSAPRLLSRFDALELATGIDVCGDVLFIGHRNNGVEFVDVSDPVHPKHIWQELTPESQSVFYKDGILYSGEWAKGLITVIDATDMSRIRTIRTVELCGYGDGVWAQGDRLYASTGHHHKNRIPSTVSGDGHGMEIFDITDPTNPKFISRVEFDIFYLTGIDYWFPRPNADRTTVFCTDTFNGFYVVDTQDETNPVVIDHYKSPGDVAITSLAVGDGAVYLACGKNGALAVESPRASRARRELGESPRNPSARPDYPTPSSSHFTAWKPSGRGQVHAAAAKGDSLFVACGDAGLYLLEDKNGQIREVSQISADFCGDVSVNGRFVYSACGGRGVDVYKIADNNTVTKYKTLLNELSTSTLNRFSFWVDTPNDQYLVSATRVRGFSFLSIGGTEDNPSYAYKNYKTLNLNYNKFISDKVCSGNLLPYHTRSGLIWVDLSKKDNVSFLGPDTAILGTTTEGITHFKDGTALYAYKKRLYTVNAGTFVPVAHGGENIEFRGIPRWDGANRVMFCSAITKNLAIVDVSNLESPKVMIAETTSGRPEAGIFWKAKAVVPCGHQGLLIEK